LVKANPLIGLFNSFKALSDLYNQFRRYKENCQGLNDAKEWYASLSREKQA